MSVGGFIFFMIMSFLTGAFVGMELAKTDYYDPDERDDE